MRKKLWVEQLKFGMVYVHTIEPTNFSSEWFSYGSSFSGVEMCRRGFELWAGCKVPESPKLLEIEVTVKIGPTWEPVE